MTVTVIKTKHKPLTKGWDTAELAGPQDVEVLVDGQAVPVQEVDPLRGRITLEDPLPKGAGLGVEVKYFYLGGPLTFDYAFHKEGWGLNQFAAHPDQFWETPHTKMPMVPSAVRRRQPALLGKTYTAFQRAYTASLNDPTTLLFNEVPSVYGGMRRKLNPFSLLWEGDKTPPEPEWRQSGGGGGGGGQHPSFEEGLFIIEDDSTSDDVVSSEPYFYGATADFTYAYSLTLNFRMKIFGFQPDGDFTGIAAGYAGDKRLAFLGFLVKDDFHFAGFLGLGGDETCWQSYHGIPAVLEADGLGRTLSFQNPVPVVAGQRIMVGASGEIRIVEAVLGHTVLVDQPFQELLPGQGTEVFVSLDYGELTSYRIYRDAETGLTKAFASGTTAPFAVLRDQDRPQSPEIYELLRANEVFFGSLSRRATNKTGWAFYRLGIMPQNPTQQQMEVAVETPFTVLPQDEGDPRQAWTLTDNQGYALLEPSSGKTVIQQAGSDTRGSFAYHRLEPFLTDQTSIVLEAGWRVYHSEAPMPWHLTVSDGRKEVTLCLFTSPDEGPTWVPIFDPPTLTGTSGGATLITGGHVPGDSGLPLITTGHLGGGPPPEEEESSGSLPLTVGKGAGVLSTKGQWPGDTGVPITTKGQVEDFQDFAAGLRGDGFRMNFPGVRSFEEEGWAQDFDANIDIDFRDHALILKKTAPNPGGGDKATKTIPFPSGNVPVSNYVTSFRLRVHEAETDALVFQVDDGENDIRIAFSRTTGGEACLRFIDEAQNDYVRDGTTGHILEVLWPWDGGTYHAYRVRRHNTLLSIFIDGAFQAWFDLKHFPQSQRVNSALTGLLLGAGAVHLELDFWFLHANEYGKRWVGLYKGGGHLYDPGSYDFIEHDWLNTDFDVRISRDPAGKTVIQFGDKSFERQYHELPDTLPRPLVNTSLGYVCFGAMQPGTHAYVRCHHLNYVIRNKPAKRRTLTQSVFNRAWPVASPEYVYDEDPETFEVPVREGNKVYLSSLGIRARRIIAVQTKEGDSPDFTFDPKANEIALENVPLEDGPEVVFVTLLHGRPYGKRYLKNQEVPVTRLNEGTPTFWASQRKQLQIDKRLLTDPDVDWPGAITLEDGQYKVTYVTGPDNFYESLNIDTELLAGQQEQNLLFPACDTGGWIQLDMWGTPGELQDIYEMPVARDICPRPLPLFLLNEESSLLDSEEAGLAKSSTPQCDVQFDVVMSLDETLGTTPQETFVEGQIVFYEGLLLDVSDKSLDDPEDLMDTSEAQPPQPILF